NYIGADCTGMIKLGNIMSGIDIHAGARGNRIGGPTAGERNIISGNEGDGVAISGEGTDGNRVLGNYIGTDVTGDAPLGNVMNGVAVYGRAKANLIGGYSPNESNVISANGSYGVIIEHDDTNKNRVAGNLIGTNQDGTVALGNARDGVFITNRGLSNQVGPNNIISGNKENGIRIQNQGTDSTIIRGNWIGLDITGQDTLPNGRDGLKIEFFPRHTVIGGPTVADRNVIAGNTFNGIRIYFDSTGYTHCINNYIGTDTSGTRALGNKKSGIEVSGVHYLFQNNLISANQQNGMLIKNAKDILVKENKIGVKADGMQALGNLMTGIRIEENGRDVIIGPENHICYNGWDGIELVDSTTAKITITQNTIAGNGYKGIRLSNGANNRITTPVILAGDPIYGTAPPDSRIEIFADSSDQGRYYLGETMADASGEWIWATTGSPYLRGLYITVTATDLQGNTSEFSNKVVFTDVADREPDVPSTYFIAQNRPNPFNPETEIDYQVAAACHVSLKIYNMLGQVVRTLVQGEKPAGFYTVIWDGRDEVGHGVAGGVYFYRFEAADFVRIRKMVVIR
ncbi:right-handed parallel beta-helix repeat-containing protein, partial [candidate division KSB1 bacterium]|nr:right-handed parallel beta-helix repeat-containing protein [candidate division KSB1 bacterium]